MGISCLCSMLSWSPQHVNSSVNVLNPRISMYNLDQCNATIAQFFQSSDGGAACRHPLAHQCSAPYKSMAWCRLGWSRVKQACKCPPHSQQTCSGQRPRASVRKDRPGSRNGSQPSSFGSWSCIWPKAATSFCCGGRHIATAFRINCIMLPKMPCKLFLIVTPAAEPT